jgi:DNA polymerase III sliding clamp (beta) subunit (PCNA family)
MIKISPLAFVAPVMSTEEVRYYLCGVHYRYEHATRLVTLTATDGHALHSVRYEVAKEDAADSAPGADKAFIIPAKAVAAMLKDKGMCYAVTDSGLQAVAGAIYAPVDGTFPDIARVMGGITRDAKHLRATFNASYLLRAASALSGVESTTGTPSKKQFLGTPVPVFGGMSITGHGAYVMALNDKDVAAARAYAEGLPGHIAIIMPMRSNVSCAVLD